MILLSVFVLICVCHSYRELLRETLLKKGSPSNSLPKTFVWFFPQWYYSNVKNQSGFFVFSA